MNPGQADHGLPDLRGRMERHYPALLLANAVYGGTTTSRLFLHVREQTFSVLLCQLPVWKSTRA